MEKKCNINTAPKDDIRTICDVGPSTAETIVKMREKTHFKSVDDLHQIPGIGETIVERMKQHGCYAE